MYIEVCDILFENVYFITLRVDVKSINIPIGVQFKDRLTNLEENYDGAVTVPIDLK